MYEGVPSHKRLYGNAPFRDVKCKEFGNDRFLD